MSGRRQGSAFALLLENQPRTEETEGTLASGAAKMVTGQLGLLPLGRGPSGAGASEQQQAQRLKRRGYRRITNSRGHGASVGSSPGLCSGFGPTCLSFLNKHTHL